MAFADEASLVPLPDCYVAGAPKCGTTALCAWLEQHPRVHVSRPKEPNVLGYDDFDLNPYAFFEAPEVWESLDWGSARERFLSRYVEAFAARQPGQLLCDGTPGYLMSERAAQRMKELTPNARIMVVLRHPTERAYSHYWHELRRRRATLPFARHLQHELSNEIRFGCYRHRLEHYYRLFSPEQILVVASEELRHDRARVLAQLARFLDIEEWNPIDEKRNQAHVPRLPWLQFGLNGMLRLYSAHHGLLDYGGAGAKRHIAERVLSGTIRRAGTWNLRASAPPPMDLELKHRLDRLFERENRGLSALVGKKLGDLWQLDV